MRNNKKESNQYIFYVDMSGQPFKDDLFIGGIFINKRFVGKFIKEFYEKFPSLRSFRKKSHNLNGEELKKIITYLDYRNIKMICIKFHKHKMNKYKQEIFDRKNSNLKYKKNLRNFKEKIVGALYYELVKVYSRKNWHYEFEMCAESHLDAMQVMDAMYKLSYRDGYAIHPRTNYRRIQHMLKFADFVAGAGRKIDDFVLKSFKNVVYLAPEIEDYDCDKLFGINKNI